MVKGIYIDLDSLLDTRLSLLMNISPVLAAIAYDDIYINRSNDVFGPMSALEFRVRYKNRDKRVLHPPLPTGIIALLETHITHLRQDDILKGGDGDVKLYLNTNPYEFSTHECSLLVGGLESKLPNGVTVEIVDDSELSVKWVKRNINTLILYDGIAFIEKNVASGKLVPGYLEGVELIVPDVIHTIEGVVPDRDLAMNGLSTVLMPFIDLTFVTVALFSTHISRK